MLSQSFDRRFPSNFEKGKLNVEPTDNSKEVESNTFESESDIMLVEPNHDAMMKLKIQNFL